MRQMAASEREMAAAWKRGLSRRRWEAMATEVGDALVSSYSRGRLMYMGEGEPLADMAVLHERARIMTMRAAAQVEPIERAVAYRHGDEMVAMIFLLFFDEDDDNLRPIARGVPAAISRRAARFDVPIATARTAHTILARDADAMALVRTIPRRSVLPALDESRRALNLGIAEAGLTRIRSESATDVGIDGGFAPQFPLWEIRELMDRRTRGNPSGDFPHDGFHWQVSGYINTMSEIIRQGCVPPCGRNCRASLFPVSMRRARELGIVDATGAIDYAGLRNYNGERQGYIDRGQYPDPRFR